MPSLALSNIIRRFNKLFGKTVSFLSPAYLIATGKSARSGYWAATDQAMISIGNFTAAIILARNTTPTEFGIYAVGFLLLHFIRAIQDGLIVQPMNAFGAIMNKQRFSEYATTTGIIQLLMASISSLLAASGGLLLTKLGNDVAGPTLFILWFPFFTWQIQEFIRRLFYTRGKIVHAALNSFLSNLSRLLLLFFWKDINALSGKAGMYAIAWGSLIALIVGFIQAKGYWTTNISPLKDTLRKNWLYGRWIIGGSSANWVAAEVYPLLAAGLISFAAAGAYRALQNLVAPVHVLLRAIDTFITPRIALIYQNEGKQGTGRLLRVVYLAVGLPIIGYLLVSWLYAVPLLRLLYGETYIPYHQGMILMVIFYGLWFLYWPLQSAFKATMQTKPIFFANLLAILSMFSIGILCIKRWGVFGAITGQVLNALLVGLVLWGIWLRDRRNHKITSG